ncbi:MAG: exosome complex protein Rrp42 [Promethearchaeota archaeon]
MESKRIISGIERKYIYDLLKKGKRIDGRGLFDFRDIKIETNLVPKAEGSALIQLGDTKIITGVKYDVGAPYPDTPEGVVTTMAEFVPFAAPFFESGPPTIEAVQMARVVDRGIRHTNCVDTKALLISPEYCYIIFLDMYVLDHCGNLIDAGAISANAALISAVLPKTRINDKGVPEWTGEYMPIPISELPISLTFGKINDIIFLDPALKEEIVMDGSLTFAIDESDNITSMQKSGNATWTQEEIINLAKISIQKARELHRKLDFRQYAPKL